jgi:hypothetical protein
LDFFSVNFHLPAIASSSEAGGDEADSMHFAYGEGKMNTLVEGCFFLPFFPAFCGTGWKGKIILVFLLILLILPAP